MGKWRRPQPIAPLHRERLGQLFVGELEAHGTRVLIDELQVPKLVKKHVIEHESADRQRWPFMPSPGSELLCSLTSDKETRQAHARRQGTQSDIPVSTVDITERARSAAAVVEVDGTEATPDLVGKTAQHNPYVFLVDIVDSIRAWHR